MQLARFFYIFIYVYIYVYPGAAHTVRTSKYALVGLSPYRRNVLNKRNPVTFPNTPPVRIMNATPAASPKRYILALVAADTQGHAASCILASTLHQPFGFVLLYKPSSCFNTTSTFWSTPSFFAVHYLDRSRSPTMVTILLVI